MNNLTDILLNLLIFGFIIGIEVLMPKLTRKDIAFSIRIPLEKLKNEKISGISKKYQKRLMFTTIPLALIISLMFNGDSNPFLYVLGIFVIIGLSINYFLLARKEVKKLKETENWTFDKKQVTIAETRKNLKGSFSTIIPFVIGGLIVLGNAFYVKFNYAQFPSEIPYHWNAQGLVTQSINKSPVSIFLLPGIQFLILIIMFFAYQSIKLSKVQLDIEDPVASKIRNNIFKKRWSNAILSIMFLLMIQFSLYNLDAGATINISSDSYSILTILFIVVIFLIVSITAVTTGQGGSRLKNDAVTQLKEMNRNDDELWKFGLFYYDKNDPSIFVEKRFGVGFTINFANPIAVLLILSLLILIGIFSFIPKILN